MAFCSKCGAPVEDGAKTCPSCAAPVQTGDKAPEQQLINNMGKMVSELGNTADRTADFGTQDIEKNKVISLLAYLSWLVLVPLFCAKDSDYAKFHCNQGLLLAICEIVTSVVIGILSIIPVIGIVFAILGSLLGILFLLLTVFGIINAVSGKAKELPIIGKYRILK